MNEPGDAWSLTAGGDDGNDATGTADRMIGIGRQRRHHETALSLLDLGLLLGRT